MKILINGKIVRFSRFRSREKKLHAWVVTLEPHGKLDKDTPAWFAWRTKSV